MNDERNWLETVAARSSEWILRQEVSGRAGFIRWAEEGTLAPPAERTGLAPSCLALKTLVMLGSWRSLPDPQRAAWLKRIRRFRLAHVPYLEGAFFDAPFLRRALLGPGLRQCRFRPHAAVRFLAACLRGETRQALTAVLDAGDTAVLPPPGAVWTPDLAAFARRLDWHQPWAAGAQLSAVLFFAARWFSGDPDSLARVREAASACLAGVFQPQSGAWSRGDPSPEQIMNGAMKVLTGMVWIDLPIPAPEALIDYCLAHPPREHGCAMTDRLYVLQRCAAAAAHRKEDIEREARGFILAARPFFHETGGFRYFPDRSQTHYYGVRIAEGRRVPDVHGTCLLAWGLALAADVLGWREELGWTLLRP